MEREREASDSIDKKSAFSTPSSPSQLSPRAPVFTPWMQTPQNETFRSPSYNENYPYTSSQGYVDNSRQFSFQNREQAALTYLPSPRTPPYLNNTSQFGGHWHPYGGVGMNNNAVMGALAGPNFQNINSRGRQSWQSRSHAREYYNENGYRPTPPFPQHSRRQSHQHARRHSSQNSRQYPGEPLDTAVVSRDICPASIVWIYKFHPSLPIIRCVREHVDCQEKALRPEGWDHPVVILRVEQVEGSTDPQNIYCICVQLTSFTGKDLEHYLQKHQENPDLAEQAIPIHHPNFKNQQLDARLGRKLYLASGELRNQSYVRMTCIFKVPFACLRAFSQRYKIAYQVRLTEESYNYLMDELKLEREPYESIEMVHSKFDEKCRYFRMSARNIDYQNVNATTSTQTNTQRDGVTYNYRY